MALSVRTSFWSPGQARLCQAVLVPPVANPVKPRFLTSNPVSVPNSSRWAKSAFPRTHPIEERRQRLERLIGRNPPEGLWLSTAVSGDPAEILKAACQQGFEGIVAKRKGAAYVDGRSRGWLKVKCFRRQEFAIVGYLPYLGTQQAVGSLVLALNEGGELRYAGKVGTGYSDAVRKELAGKLDAHPAKTPAARDVPRFGGIARWTQPRLVAEVAFSEWTEAGHVRHPSFQGLRADKKPLDCVKEVAVVHAARSEKMPAKTAGHAPARKADEDKPVVRGIPISHASRVLEPTGLTKLELARYYDAVADRMVSHVKGRPLTLLRWTPDRSDTKGGIYLRHGKAWGPKELRRVPIQEKTKVGEYLVADTAEALVALAQMDILEIHTWNSTVDDLERPNRVVFDIDPDVSLGWSSVVLAATRIRERLTALHLKSFVKTTGGKGLHVVVPLLPSAGWDACLAFTRAFAQSLERELPKDYVSSMTKAQRRGRVFIDYLRNNRGSTSVSAFSTRARAGGLVSMPIPWEAVAEVDPAAFTVTTAARQLLEGDPWKEYATCRQSLPMG
jgi:bifunctional non-homologous end joining protein LigD